MTENVIFSSEYISISKEKDGIYIQSFKKGMLMEQISKLMLDFPEIKITSVMTIRNAIINAPRPPEKFAESKERITIELSEDAQTAYVILSVAEEELSGSKRTDLIVEIMNKLRENGITFGIKNSVLSDKMCNDTKILIAEGILPVNGEDSKVRTYEIKEARPEVNKDGKVDHYELNLINRVVAGDWLGERTDPTDGVAGKTVKGSILLPVKGKNMPLHYDKNSVIEEYTDGKTTLYARINGAVHFEGDKIGVSNHLEITGNIDFKTGNIDFDGFLTVKGTVEDGFSVAASKDIMIQGEYGIGGVKCITSREGSIFIKGGITGNNKAVICSNNNIYAKFVSDTTIVCEGRVYIGYYCLNSNIKAKEVILDSPTGQIIGGNIEAEIRVIASTIGSEREIRTNITVSGFDRSLLKQSLNQVSIEAEELKIDLAKTKSKMSVYDNAHGPTKEQAKTGEKNKDHYFALRDRIKQCEEQRKVLTGYLKTHGEGEISILKKVYPNTKLEIKKMIREITTPVICTSFYVQNGEMHEL